MKRLLSAIVATSVIANAMGCGQSGTKEIPDYSGRESQPAKAPPSSEPKLPPGHPPITPSTNDMSQQSLPSGALAEAKNPYWSVPKEWQEGRPSSIRRGSWAVAGPEGQNADIAVTVFPGDVGGPLANINRWRGQIGLGPIKESEVDSITTKLEVNGLNVSIVDFSSDKQRVLVATIPHEGNSWFVKMTGSKALVEAQKNVFLDFVKSVKF